MTAAIVLAVSLLAGGLLLAGEGGTTTEPVVIHQKGSDTLLELCKYEWAVGYHQIHPLVTVDVRGGGSSTGFQALIAGDVEIAQASRPIKGSEMDAAVANGIHPYEIPVAIDGIAVLVHSSNPITELDMDSLQGIYNGTITNWDEVGGYDMGIVAYGRENVSGTYAFFQEHVLDGEEYSPEMDRLAGNQAIANAVNNDPQAIGYVGLGYARGLSNLKILYLKADDSSMAYSPLNEEAVTTGDYVLARYLYLYTDGRPSGMIRDYVEWILSADGGQPSVDEIGFYTLPQAKIDQILADL